MHKVQDQSHNYNHNPKKYNKLDKQALIVTVITTQTITQITIVEIILYQIQISQKIIIRLKRNKKLKHSHRKQ